ncbi:hypothetical protein [Crossiella sp. CA198]|uniref:hypothetical protein n=1 Tax=Crossiella sp. CA198 TaxID=3455607 RepID=UPI003F8D7A55
MRKILAVLRGRTGEQPRSARCARCQDGRHTYHLADEVLPDNGFVAAACCCEHCLCDFVRSLRFLPGQPYAVHPPDHSAPPALRPLLDLHAAYSARSQRIQVMSLRAESSTFRKAERETNWAIAANLGSVLALTVLLVCQLRFGWPAVVTQAVFAVCVLSLVGTATSMLFKRFAVLSAAVAAYAERHGPLGSPHDQPVPSVIPAPDATSRHGSGPGGDKASQC